jgi:hypothetical protein
MSTFFNVRCTPLHLRCVSCWRKIGNRRCEWRVWRRGGGGVCEEQEKTRAKNFAVLSFPQTTTIHRGQASCKLHFISLVKESDNRQEGVGGGNNKRLCQCPSSEEHLPSFACFFIIQYLRERYSMSRFGTPKDFDRNLTSNQGTPYRTRESEGDSGCVLRFCVGQGVGRALRDSLYSHTMLVGKTCKADKCG